MRYWVEGSEYSRFWIEFGELQIVEEEFKNEEDKSIYLFGDLPVVVNQRDLVYTSSGKSIDANNDQNICKWTFFSFHEKDYNEWKSEGHLAKAVDYKDAFIIVKKLDGAWRLIFLKDDMAEVGSYFPGESADEAPLIRRLWELDEVRRNKREAFVFRKKVR